MTPYLGSGEATYIVSSRADCKLMLLLVPAVAVVRAVTGLNRTQVLIR